MSTLKAGTHPADIAAIRRCIGLLLPHHLARHLAGDDLTALTESLRGHTHRLIKQVEEAAARRPAEDVPRYVALACARQARAKLHSHPRPGPHGPLVYARRLARVLAALCDHYEAFANVAMCLACDQPLRDGEQTMPYDKVSPSGGAARAGRIHTRCANTVRRN